MICIAYLSRSKYFISFHYIRKDRPLISTNYTFELVRFTIFFPTRKNKINSLRYNSAYNCSRDSNNGLSTTFKDCFQVYLLNDHLIKNIVEKRMLTHLFPLLFSPRSGAAVLNRHVSFKLLKLSWIFVVECRWTFIRIHKRWKV